MTDNTQPEALRMANALEYCDASVARQAINELRRLHAENETLRAKLKTHEDLGDAGSDVQLLRMGYAAARLEIESLKSQSAAQRWNPMENGNSETALQMAAVIAHRDAAGMGDPLVTAATAAVAGPSLYQVMAVAKAIHATTPDADDWDSLRQCEVDALRGRAEKVLAALAAAPTNSGSSFH